ncbi:MAG: methyltransferase domain-containing protein [Erysipelothrix sp.]|nr:methyltransferase domain-containing protein [Erysipelothrix sp.]
MKSNTELIHQWMEETIQKDWVCVDMTCGKGRDTLEMAKLAHHVTSIDIQEAAIEQAKALSSQYDNITFIQDDHINISNYVKDFIHLAIFNLGYLPDGNKKIQTTADSTLMALSKIYPRIRKNGYLVVTCYVGHKGGKEEHETVKRWIDHYKNFETTIIDSGKRNAPITYICKKTSFDSR